MDESDAFIHSFLERTLLNDQNLKQILFSEPIA